MKYSFYAMAAMTFFLGGCHYINEKLGLDDDNFAEELAEYVIEQKTGLELDLTPGSPE